VTVLSLVIPCLNEVDRLPPSLRQIAHYLEQADHWLPTELIVVDDGSTDDTAVAARSVAMPTGIRLAVERHDRNRGKGAAVRTGFLRSSGDHLLLCDADLATPIDQLEVLRQTAAGTQVVFGSRALDRSLIAVRQPVYRDLMGRGFNLAVQALVLRGVQDTQCGFKLFPGSLGRALAHEQRVSGFAYDVELLVLARRWGFDIVEVPVAWQHVEASRVRAIRHSSQMIRDVLVLWLRGLTGRLPARPGSLEGGR
jgi:dolichyl-phosphate beta-glucosyltransferase